MHFGPDGGGMVCPDLDPDPGHPCTVRAVTGADSNGDSNGTSQSQPQTRDSIQPRSGLITWEGRQP